MAVKNQGNKIPPNRPVNRTAGRPENRLANISPSSTQQQRSRDEIRREQAIKRRRMKKKKQLVFTCFFLILLIIIGIVLSLTVFFKIEKITVEGNTIYSNEKIIEASGIKKKDNLFLTREENIKQKVEEKLPYIGSLDIKRKLPGEIVLKVEKTTEKCAIVSGNGFVITNEYNKVLKVGAKEAGENLTVLVGGDINKAEIGKQVEFKNKNSNQLLIDIMKALKENNISDITKIDVSNKLDIKLSYQNRIDILVGSVSALDKKIKFATEIIKKENERSNTQEGIIDLHSVGTEKSSKDKAYFREKEEPTTAKETTTTTTTQAA